MTKSNAAIFTAVLAISAGLSIIYVPWPALCVGGLSALCYLSFRHVSGLQVHRNDGWNYLAPPPQVKIGLILGCLVVASLVYLYFFVESARDDAEQQEIILRGLTITFIVGVLFSMYRSIGITTRWNSSHIEQSELWILTGRVALSEIVLVRTEKIHKRLRLEGSDGSVVQVPLHYSGAQALLEFLTTKIDLDASHFYIGDDEYKL